MPGSWEPFGSTRREEPPDAGAGPAPAGASVPPPDAPGAAPAPSAAPAPGTLRPQPARQLAIVTCMDARIDPLAVLGLRLGDANVIRNAGAIVSDDVLRSLGAAVSKLGVTRAVVMGHTTCAAHPSDEAAAAAVADGARRIRGAMPGGFGIETLMYDVATGDVHAV